jgi:hypothetical protein
MVDIIHKPFSAQQIHTTLARALGTAPPARADDRQPGSPPSEADATSEPYEILVLARLAALIGDAKVKALLSGLATSLAARFDSDPDTAEGRATFRRQAHASVAGSGMLGFGPFAAQCKALEIAAEDDAFPGRARALIEAAAAVIEAASALAAQDRTLEAMAVAA